MYYWSKMRRVCILGALSLIIEVIYIGLLSKAETLLWEKKQKQVYLKICDDFRGWFKEIWSDFVEL